MNSRNTQRVAAKWAGADAGERYDARRFRSARAARRDPALVAGLLRDLGVRGRVLDVPCGTGRLRAALAAFDPRAVGVDASAAMLARASGCDGRRLVRGDVRRLPFADRAFDVVVCCRLLHHLREPAELEQVIAELVRVSNRLVVASFWDAASWPNWRARVWPVRPRGRFAVRRDVLRRAFESAGATPLEFRGVLRWVSQQTFVVAERQRA